VASRHFLPVSLTTRAGCVAVFAPLGLVWIPVLIGEWIIPISTKLKETLYTIL